MDGSSANSTDVSANSPRSTTSSTVALYLCVLVYAVVAVLVLLGNGLVIMSFCWRATIRTNINFFIVSLSVADGFVGMISVPWWIYITLGFHSGEIWITFVHNIWIIFDILGGVCSILHLVALSWDRLCAIVWPLNHRTFSSSKYLLLLSLIWLISLTVAILSLPGRKYALMEYNVTVIVTCFFFPLIVICVTQIAIMRSVQQRTRYQCRRFGLRQNVRVAKTIGVMIGLFCLGWTPFFSLSLATFLNLINQVPFWALHAVKLLQYSNSAVNPMLYAHNFPHFRRAYAAMLRSCCKVSVWLANERPQRGSNYTYTTTSSLYSSKYGQSADNRKPKAETQFLHETRATPTSYDKSFLLPTSFAAKEAAEKITCSKTKQETSAMPQSHVLSRSAIIKFSDVSEV